MNRLLDLARRHVLLVCTFSFLTVYAASIGSGSFGGKPLRSDGHGYYAFLPAALLHHDLSFASVVHGPYQGRADRLGLALVEDTGRYASKYTIGVSLLQAPFFAMGHLLTLAFTNPQAEGWESYQFARDGYSFFYQHAAGLSGVAYAVLGLALLRGLLARFFSPQVVAATLYLLTFGTSFLHYASVESCMSHSFSFFLFAAFLREALTWQAAPQFRHSLRLGFLLGLIALVRPPNLLLGVLLPLLGSGSLRERSKRALGLWRHYLAILGLVLLLFVPQVLLWRYSTGAWFVHGYAAHGEGFRWLHPQVTAVLFSIRKGLLFYAPVLALAVAGLPFLRRYRTGLHLAVPVALLAFTYVISSWWMWWYGGSFGHRAFVELNVLFAFPLAALLQSCRGRAALLLRGAALFACLWTLWWMKLYNTREYHIEGLDASALFDIFWVRFQLLKSFLGLP